MKDLSMTRLAAADPVPNMPSGLDARAQADLERITGTWSTARTPDTGTRRSTIGPSRRLLLAAGAVTLTGLLTAALVLGVGVRGGGPPALAATPTALTVLGPDTLTAAGLAPGMSAAAALGVIADRTERLANDVGTGPYARITTEGWYLNTTVDGETVTSKVVPSRTTTWRAKDGSGRSVTQTLPPGSDAGKPRENSLNPGGSYWLGGITADGLATQLEVAHPPDNGPAERFFAVADLSREQPLSPELRAVVLRYLGATPGLTDTSMVRDRAGRTGLAISLDNQLGGLPNRQTLVVGTDDGRILASEETLTQTAGALNVPIPSVISYTTFLDARFVTTPTSD